MKSHTECCIRPTFTVLPHINLKKKIPCLLVGTALIFDKASGNAEDRLDIGFQNLS